MESMESIDDIRDVFGSYRESITQVLECRMAREKQDDVAMLIARFVDEEATRLDGFLEASVNKSLAGEAVLVLVEWETQSHHASSLKQPAVQRMLKEVQGVCSGVESYLYERISSHGPRPLDAHATLGAGRSPTAHGSPTGLQ